MQFAVSWSIDGVIQEVISYLSGSCNKIILLHQNYMYYPQNNCRASRVILGNIHIPSELADTLTVLFFTVWPEKVICLQCSYYYYFKGKSVIFHLIWAFQLLFPLLKSRTKQNLCRNKKLNYIYKCSWGNDSNAHWLN